MTLAQLEVAMSDAPGMNEEVTGGGDAYAAHVVRERAQFIQRHLIKTDE